MLFCLGITYILTTVFLSLSYFLENIISVNFYVISIYIYAIFYMYIIKIITILLYLNYISKSQFSWKKIFDNNQEGDKVLFWILFLLLIPIGMIYYFMRKWDENKDPGILSGIIVIFISIILFLENSFIFGILFLLGGLILIPYIRKKYIALS